MHHCTRGADGPCPGCAGIEEGITPRLLLRGAAVNASVDTALEQALFVEQAAAGTAGDQEAVGRLARFRRSLQSPVMRGSLREGDAAASPAVRARRCTEPGQFFGQAVPVALPPPSATVSFRQDPFSLIINSPCHAARSWCGKTAVPCKRSTMSCAHQVCCTRFAFARSACRGSLEGEAC